MFKDVTVKTFKRNRHTEYTRLVSVSKPNFNGSGRVIETVTDYGGGIVYSKSQNGYVRSHTSLEDAANSFGWEKV